MSSSDALRAEERGGLQEGHADVFEVGAIAGLTLKMGENINRLCWHLKLFVVEKGGQSSALVKSSPL